MALRAAPWTGISFVENRGQWDSPACFVARSGALALGAEPNALVLLVRDEGPAQDDPLVVRLEFERARTDPCVAGLDPLPGVRHYYLGDPEAARKAAEAVARQAGKGSS